MFVPAEFRPPTSAVVTSAKGSVFRLEPLDVVHNERDHRAWMSSIDHIHASPGFAERRWPQPMTLEENERDLARHADDFAAHTGFTYTVLDADDDVVGCVYIYPDEDDPAGAAVRSWVRADHADLDTQLRTQVAQWLSDTWPFERLCYDGVA